MKFRYRWGIKPWDQKQETRNECDVISEPQASWKTDSSTIFWFSYKQGTFVPFLGELISSQWQNYWEICFTQSLKSWNDVTIIPSLLFLVWLTFCTPPGVKFHVFGTGTSKHWEGKSLSKFFLLYFSVYWRDLIKQIKKICLIHFKKISAKNFHF